MQKQKRHSYKMDCFILSNPITRPLANSKSRREFSAQLFGSVHLLWVSHILGGRLYGAILNVNCWEHFCVLRSIAFHLNAWVFFMSTSRHMLPYIKKIKMFSTLDDVTFPFLCHINLIDTLNFYERISPHRLREIVSK